MAAFLTPRTSLRAALLLSGLALAACDTGSLDLDMRDNMGGTFSTSGAAATEPRPVPDARGVITYPDYAVAVAGAGDSVSQMAARLGQDPTALARANGLSTDATLREGELLVLPASVGAPTGPVDIASVAAGAIERAELPDETAQTTATAVITDPDDQPVRHRVQRGETAFTIARLYGVSPRALADWNGLGPDLAVREGQTLLIPLVVPETTTVASGTEDAAPAETATAAAAAATATTAPGAGSPTPVPPSATQPLPEPEPVAEAPEPANLDQFQTEVSDTARFAYPVSGRIIRPYEKGRNDGIGIGASAGAPVTAAEAGEVAAITQDTDQVPILVLRHPGNVLTVYANVADIAVSKGDSVSRGQRLASVAPGDPAFLHFEIREGVESVDPLPFLE